MEFVDQSWCRRIEGQKEVDNATRFWKFRPDVTVKFALPTGNFWRLRLCVPPEENSGQVVPV